MAERAHNVASEFAAAVRASGPRDHVKKLAGRYSTAFALALAALNYRQFNQVEPMKSWRRGQAKPRAWAVQILCDRLEECAELCYEISEQLRQDVGPGSPGQAGAAHWRRYNAMKKAAQLSAADSSEKRMQISD